MRRALRWASLIAAALAASALVTGPVTSRSDPSPWPALHAGLGLAAAVVASLVAAKLFLIGLHGLLEGGRRVRALVLFVLGPCLMGLALMVSITGLTQAVADLADPPLSERHRREGIAAAAAGGLAAAAAWALARRQDEDAS